MREKQGFEGPLIGPSHVPQAADKVKVQETAGCIVYVHLCSQRFVLYIAEQLVKWDGYQAIFAIWSRILHLEPSMLRADGILLSERWLGLHELYDELVGSAFEWKLCAFPCVFIVPLVTEHDPRFLAPPERHAPATHLRRLEIRCFPVGGWCPSAEFIHAFALNKQHAAPMHLKPLSAAKGCPVLVLQRETVAYPYEALLKRCEGETHGWQNGWNRRIPVILFSAEGIHWPTNFAPGKLTSLWGKLAEEPGARHSDQRRARAAVGLRLPGDIRHFPV